MNERSLSIYLGNNSKELLGCENDAIMFYNLPNQVSKKYLLIGKDVTFYNLEKIFKNNKTARNLLFYFSGHGHHGGGLEFKETIIIPLKIYESINNNFINNLNIYFILDCCYSGSFPLVKNFQKINNVYILASCKENQKSLETLISYTPDNFILIKPKLYKKYKLFKEPTQETIVVGAFTYNLIKIIKDYNLTDINTWFLIENEKIWKKLEDTINQKITIIK
jgi:hypothetical protein